MGFREILREQLGNKLEKRELELIPAGFQRIGDIIIVNLPEELVRHKNLIGEIILSEFRVRSVCNKIGEIKGEFREPQIEVIAGDENTVAISIENGCKYKFDVRKVMFAKGNLSERVRIAKQVKREEIVVDMFSGIGYFSVPIGVFGKPKEHYCIELNPVSFEFLKENMRINKIHNAEVINGDCREEVDRLIERGVRADRVLMGYLPPPKEFLNSAFKIIKKGGILHYEEIVIAGRENEEIERVMRDIKEAGKKGGFKTRLLLAKRVKSYGPKKDHYVFDVKVE
jgi:tRNA wybutosine-synthesizing protein 2